MNEGYWQQNKHLTSCTALSWQMPDMTWSSYLPTHLQGHHPLNAVLANDSNLVTRPQPGRLQP